MSKSKKKKKKSASKAQYEAKKKSLKNTVSAAVENTAASEQEELVDINSKDTARAEASDSVSEIIAEAAEEQAEIPSEDTAEAETCETPMPAAPSVEIPYDPDFTEKDFCDSVASLTADDITVPEEMEKASKEKKKISKAENVIQIFLLVVCGSVALACIFMLGKNIWGKIKGQEIYSNTQFDGFTLEDNSGDYRYLPKPGSDIPLQTLFERIDAGKTSVNEDTSGKYDQQLAQMKASLSALKAQNDDIYGWIYVPGTNINHPVVRCDDNNFYLTHAHTKEYLPIGAIFADLTTADLITDNYNTVIYGHNVVSKGPSSMFHDAEKFLDHEFFKNNKIYIYTMDGAFIYEPVAIYDTVSDYFYFKTVFSSEADFLSFAGEMVKNSKFYTGATFESGDTMLTLSTCTNATENGRYSLHAKLVEVIK